MFLAIVNRYHEREVHQHQTLNEALAEYESEEQFFIGAINSETGEVWLPEVTAIGFSQGEALLQILEATNLQINAIRKFKLVHDTSTVPSAKT